MTNLVIMQYVNLSTIKRAAWQDANVLFIVLAIAAALKYGRVASKRLMGIAGPTNIPSSSGEGGKRLLLLD